MEFDRIVITISVVEQGSDREYVCSIEGIQHTMDTEVDIKKDLGTFTGKTKSSVLDFIIDKVEV